MRDVDVSAKDLVADDRLAIGGNEERVSAEIVCDGHAGVTQPLIDCDHAGFLGPAKTALHGGGTATAGRRRRSRAAVALLQHAGRADHDRPVFTDSLCLRLDKAGAVDVVHGFI